MNEDFTPLGIVVTIVIVAIAAYKIIGKPIIRMIENKNKLDRWHNMFDEFDSIIKKNGFVISKDYTYYLNPTTRFARVVIDDLHKKIYTFSSTGKYYTIPYNIVRYCRTEEDYDSTSPTVGRAIAGGLIAGEAGAVVGAMSARDKAIITGMSLVIVLDDINLPEVTLPLSYEGRGDYQKAVSFAKNVENALDYIGRHGSVN